LPGIFSPSQIAGWKKDNDVVHAKGGYMYCQLWHVSRATVFSFIEGKDFLGASDTPISGNALDESEYAASPPRAMTVQEIQDTMHEYAAAAKRAREAGFDGVEVHRKTPHSLRHAHCLISQARRLPP
jgi:2,4-dienoyl-CoA reductase-like NADH-dependent reductase (Old Yellow Enzyme family)